MKKRFFYSSLLVLSSLLCFAQDTIVFKTGEKDGVNIVSFGKKNMNFILDDTLYSVNQSRINYIKYRNGASYSFKDMALKFDSINKPANAEMEKEDSADFRPLRINIGVGGSSIEAKILTNDNIPGGGVPPPYFISQSPAYNCVIDYAFIKWLSVGIGGVYQVVNDNPGYGGDQTATWETEKITRYNYSARILYHPLKHSDLDIYAGVRMGESGWKEQIVSNSQGTDSITYKTSVPSSREGSFQAIVGFVIPVYYCIGIHAELGVGTPYTFEAGISFLLKK